MATSAGDLLLRVGMDLSNAQQGLAQLKTDVAAAAGAVQTASGGMVTSATAANTALKSIGVGLSIVAVAAFLKSASEKALEAEKSFTQLKFAVNAATDGSFPGFKDKVLETTNATARMAIVTDNLAQNVLKTLITNTGQVTGSMANLNLVFDVATAKDLDYTSAARLVGLAMTGNTEAIGRMFPEFRHLTDTLGDTATKSERAAFGMDLLHKKFDGATAAVGDHTRMLKEGAKAWEDWKESAGNSVLSVLGFTKRLLVDTSTDIFNRLAGGGGIRQQQAADAMKVSTGGVDAAAQTAEAAAIRVRKIQESRKDILSLIGGLGDLRGGDPIAALDKMSIGIASAFNKLQFVEGKVPDFKGAFEAIATGSADVDRALRIQDATQKVVFNTLFQGNDLLKVATIAERDYAAENIKTSQAMMEAGKKKNEQVLAGMKAIQQAAFAEREYAKQGLRELDMQDLSTKLKGETPGDQVDIIRRQAFMSNLSGKDRLEELKQFRQLLSGITGEGADDAQRLNKALGEELSLNLRIMGRNAEESFKKATDGLVLAEENAIKFADSLGLLQDKLAMANFDQLMRSANDAISQVNALAQAIAALPLTKDITVNIKILQSGGGPLSLPSGGEGGEGLASGSRFTREGLAYLHDSEAVIPAHLNFLSPGLSRAERTARLLRLAGGGIPHFQSGTTSFDPSFGVADMVDTGLGSQHSNIFQHIGVTQAEFTARANARLRNAMQSGVWFDVMGQQIFQFQEAILKKAFASQMALRSVEAAGQGTIIGAPLTSVQDGTSGITFNLTFTGGSLSTVDAIKAAVQNQVLPLLNAVVLRQKSLTG